MAKNAAKIMKTQPTGHVVHDARGNSVWRFNEAEDAFRDTQTWVVRQLEVPGLTLVEDKTVRYAGDPYNRGSNKHK
jgi:hypothetical protein